jgi:hypothetical protein
MDPLRAELEAILAEAAQREVGLVVVGAFAVRTYLRDPDRRRTHDLDLVALPTALEALGKLLSERGYHVYPSTPWWRAERGSGRDRIIIDIGAGAVVDMASFESYPLDVAEAQPRAEPGAAPIPVPPLEDLLAMKILAHRDKDILDVIAILRDAGDAIDVHKLRRRIDARDLEIPLQRGYLAIVAAIESGELLADALRRLHTMFR